ncbi:hypothetical protein [Gynuella sp.]|uniref:hypothetical protein n=1 Tax=Gynuella sp. TaxID=2969146 RepID=UPI003D0E1B00
MFRLPFLSILFIWLAGCSGTTIQPATIDPKTMLGKEQGLVVLEVVNNTHRLSEKHNGWTEVIALRVDPLDAARQDVQQAAEEADETYDPEQVKWKPDVYSLTPAKEGTQTSQLFVGSLPPGDYMISRLFSYDGNSDVTMWISMPVMQASGLFHVSNGTVSNLGTLVFQPLSNIEKTAFWEWRSSDKGFVTRLPEQTDLHNFVFTKYPEYRSTFQPDNNAWNPDALDNLRNQLASLVKQNAYASQAVRLNQSDQRALLGKLGQLKIIDQDNHWNSFSLPTNDQLNAILETDQGLIVGSERGQLFTLMPDRSWFSSHPVPRTEAIVWLGSSPDTHFALTRSDQNYYVYQFTDVQEAWEQVNHFVAPASTGMEEKVSAFIGSDDILHIISHNKHYRYHQSEKSWDSQPSPAIWNVQKLKDGTLTGNKFALMGLQATQVISVDDGISWQKISRSTTGQSNSKAKVSPVAILENGLVVTSGKPYSARLDSTQRFILTSSKADVQKRNSWQSHYPIYPYCQTLIPQLTNANTLFFLCSDGSIVSTPDLGKSWQTEMNIDLNAMLKTYTGLLNSLKQTE